ncbi:hypothetical protein BGY98DRAFT_975104 [Russula aff. rugulosa BPL654]|nr:hypothetical protein BGY98DRAFT_975104 [Russula aff. rugulosa BPL654]
MAQPKATFILHLEECLMRLQLLLDLFLYTVILLIDMRRVKLYQSRHTGYRRSLCQSFSTPQKTFILIYAPYVVAMHASAIVTIFCLDIVFAPSLAAPSTQ